MLGRFHSWKWIKYQIMAPTKKGRKDIIIALVLIGVLAATAQSARTLLTIGAGVAALFIMIGIYVGIRQWLFLRKVERQRRGDRRK